MPFSVDEWTVQMHRLSNTSQISNSFNFNSVNSVLELMILQLESGGDDSCKLQ